MSVEVLFDCGDGEVERLKCRPAEGDTYVVESIPLVACGLSVGDTIRAEKTKTGTLEAIELVEKSGHSTLTAYPDDEQVETLKKRVASLGGAFVETDDAFAIDLPHSDAFVLFGGWLDDEEIDYEVADPVIEDDEE